METVCRPRLFFNPAAQTLSVTRLHAASDRRQKLLHPRQSFLGRIDGDADDARCGLPWSIRSERRRQVFQQHGWASAFNTDETLGRIRDEAFGGTGHDDVACLRIEEHVLDGSQTGESPDVIREHTAGSQLALDRSLKSLQRDFPQFAGPHDVVAPHLSSGEQTLLGHAWIEHANFQDTLGVDVDTRRSAGRSCSSCRHRHRNRRRRHHHRRRRLDRRQESKAR